MTTPDFRALCAELANVLHCYASANPQHNTDALVARARAALAEPQPYANGRPSDEEFLKLAAKVIEPYESCGIAVGEYEAETNCAVEVYGSELVQFALAVLARWGTWGVSCCHRLQQENHRFREPERTILCDILANGTLLPDPDGRRYGVPPADGEVWNLAADMRQQANHAYCEFINSSDLNRAADLLERQHRPVPVSERLPEAKDCTSNPRNGQGQWCWGWKKPGTIGTVALLFSGEWRMMRRESLTDDATHWLPYWFLPLPSEEE